MPKIESKKNGKPSKTSPAQAKPTTKAPPKPFKVVEPEREVLYPVITVNGIEIPEESTKITVALAKELLGWEPEDAYKTRVVQENPKVKIEQVGYGEDFLLIDVEGKRVKCWNNSRNRPFHEKHALELCQDVLNKNWRLNLENIIISRTGIVTSGQHRLVGLVLAYQKWKGKNSNHWQTIWPEEPYIESLVAFGGSDDPKVIQTIDNVLTRTLSDVVYTSDIFRDLTSNVDRRECSRMLDIAVDTLWKRTGVEKQGSFEKYQTHSTSMGFLDRHKKLEECVKHIWGENKDRVLSKLKLSPGKCSAMLYLMGSSDSDVDEYTNVQPAPSEKVLDWDNWPKAKAFWVALAKVKPEDENPIRLALADLVEDENISGGRDSEKFAILARAWGKTLEGEEYTKEDLLSEDDYTIDQYGIKHFTADPVFGGIDLGSGKKEKKVEPTPEEIEEQKKSIREAKGHALAGAVEASKPQSKPPGEVAKPAPVKFDKEGKPPPPKMILRKGPTSKK